MFPNVYFKLVTNQGSYKKFCKIVPAFCIGMSHEHLELKLIKNFKHFLVEFT